MQANSIIQIQIRKGKIMKKSKLIVCIMLILLMITTYVYAESQLAIEVSYDGNVVKNEAKNANIVLAGTDATLHSKVRIKVTITGPATPTLMATDSEQHEIDIAEVGYWGPEQGFAIQGTFQNTTPVRATFPKAGDYTIKIDLIDLEQDNAVLVTKTVSITVLDESPVTNIIQNTATNATTNTVQNVQQLPKTGASVVDYGIYFAIGVVIIYCVYILNKKRMG